MNKELRRISLLVLLLFLALFGSSTVIQFFQAGNLKADARNVRTLYDSFDVERGPILVADQTIAESVPSDDAFQFQREYTAGRLYSAATGYFTIDQGITGVEGSLNDLLSGTADEQFLDRVNAILTGQDPKGAAVQLTIDPDVQRAAWDALGDKKGAVVALDPKTGAILAMVSKPTFDPNDLAGHDSKQVIATYDDLLADSGDPLINRTIAGDLYHPGSTFKLVVAAAALESGQYSADSEFDNPARLQLPQSSTFITNSSKTTCGSGSKATITAAIQYSCNIPMAELGSELGYDTIAEQARKFGFEDASLKVPMAVTPSVYPQTDSEAQLMLSSFGQANDRVTPLQVAMVSSALANDGVLMRPQLVRDVTAPNLSELQGFTPEVYSNPVSADTANSVTEMMIASVQAGAASNARIEGIQVAGKTGTAENGTGTPNTLWFTGFAPADDPQVAIAVVLEDNGGVTGDAFGNTVAAPIAKKVIEAVLNR